MQEPLRSFCVCTFESVAGAEHAKRMLGEVRGRAEAVLALSTKGPVSLLGLLDGLLPTLSLPGARPPGLQRARPSGRPLVPDLCHPAAAEAHWLAPPLQGAAPDVPPSPVHQRSGGHEPALPLASRTPACHLRELHEALRWVQTLTSRA